MIKGAKTRVAILKDFKRKLVSKKNEKRTVFTELKYNYKYRDIQLIFNDITNIKIYNKFLLGNPFPKKYSDLRNMGGYLYYDKKSSLERELFWESLVLKGFQEEINTFLIFKEQYEEYLLKGDYEDCNELLNKIEKDICVSMWSMEQRFILLELQNENSQEEIQKYKEKINKDEHDVIIYLYAEFLSRRVDVSTSTTKYSQTLKKYLDDVPKEFNEYFMYKLDFFQYKPVDLQDIVYLEATSSIIDRYLTFIRVIQLRLSSIHKEENEEKIFFRNLLNNINDISDSRLKVILRYLEPEKEIILSEIDKKFLEVTDFYTVGQYENSFSSSLNLLALYPNCIDLYEILLKSLIHSNQSFKEANLIEGQLSVSILSKFYDVLIKNDKTYESTMDLIKYIRVIGSSDWAIQLFVLLSKNFNSKLDEFSKMFYLNSKVASPKFAEVFTNYSDAKTFVKGFKRSHKSKTSEFWTVYIDSYESKQETLILTDNSIPKLRKRLYYADILMHKKEYSKAISIYKKLLEETVSDIVGLNKNYFYEQIVTNLYKCYLDDKKYKQAIELYLDNFLENELLTLRVDLEPLIEEIQNSEDNELHREIGLPIIFQIAIPKAYDQIYTCYDNFLLEWNIMKPSDLVNVQENFKRDRLIYFLRRVCVTEIMDYSFVFENSLELEKERISILQLLIELDSNNTNIYSEEISKITQKIMLRERMQQVDESKIFVDVQGIKGSIGDFIKESFKKYIGLTSSNESYVIDLTNNDETGSILFIKPNFSNNAQYVLFKEMFFEIRDSFISSNEYGLDSYLSVRIRHGTLLGQLRSHFEKFNLVTSKIDKESHVYLDNVFWSGKFQFNDEFSEKQFQSILSTFSKKIDDIIGQVLQDWMHIKTELKASKGLFDFSIKENVLYGVYLNCQKMDDYNQFFDYIIQVLWEITEYNLKIIRNKISYNLKEFFVDELNQLEHNINQLDVGISIKELNKSIASCRTNIQHELEKISRWFQLTKNRDDFEFTVEQLIVVCLEIVNNVHPKFRLCKVEYDIDTEVILSGTVFPYFVDMILILLDNIIKHSGCKMDQIKINLKVYTDQKNNLIFDIENNIIKDKDEEVRLKIKQIQESINKAEEHIELVRKEGGSGYLKILKILKYDLKKVFSIQFPETKKDLFNVKISLGLG